MAHLDAEREATSAENFPSNLWFPLNMLWLGGLINVGYFEAQRRVAMLHIYL